MFNNIEKLKYTLRHKKAFLETEKELLGKNTIDGYLHDMDKVFMLALLFWCDDKAIQKWHRSHNKHHLENNLEKTEKDYMQMVIDWECARKTKPDKPLNAYDTMVKFYPQARPNIIPLLEKYLPHQIKDRTD